MTTLAEAYKQTPYKVSGHGPRNLSVLTQAIDALPNELESDMYGKGSLIEAFEKKMANYLGTESAVFFPSGTMAQQIAFRLWCEEKGIHKVAYHPLCHLEIHEEDGLKKLHNIEPVLLADRDRVIQLEDITGLDEEIACLLLELPQREIGGQLPDLETLEKISTYCKEKGIRLHLDGARLFEILPFYKKSAAEICSLFDSVYVSFYKGIGGLAGAILAGPASFTEQSKVWKRRHGGDLISLYPYVLTADYYFDLRIEKMPQYYEEAIELARLFNQCEGIETRPEVPVSNMFHVHFKGTKETIESVLTEAALETGVGLTSYLKAQGDPACSFELSIGDLYEAVPKEKLKEAFAFLNQKLKG